MIKFAGLSVPQLALFTRLLSVLKNDILLVQPACLSATEAPAALPPSIVEFLSHAVGIDQERVPVLWKELKSEVWAMEPATLGGVEEDMFRKHGWKRGLTSLMLYPPSHFCLNTACSRQTTLKDCKTRQAVVYTLDKGVMPAHAIQLHCPQCNTTYFPDYYVNSSLRTYYCDSVPDYLHVGAHQFIETKLVSLWTSLLLVAWVSASNFSRVYDMALSGQTEHDSPREDVTSLLFLIRASKRIVTRPRWKRRNKDIVANGQDAIDHACDTCLRTCVYEDGEEVDVQPIISDGLSMGHPRCGVPGGGCTKPLANNRKRFCNDHASFEKKCAVTTCYKEIVPETKSCDDPVHVEMERQHYARGKAAFTLTERLQRHRQAHPANDDDEGLPEIEEGEDVEWFEQDAGGNVKIRSGTNPGSVGIDDDPLCEASKSPEGNRKLTAQYGRVRSHSEQILVRSCGVVVGRATMHHAEAVSNLLYFTQEAFSVPRAHKPDFLIYDTACDAQRQVLTHPEQWSWFRDVKFPVDVFHFLNKHGIYHEFCQEWCNPADFPELLGPDGRWFFNTSIAEQTNVWLGGYHSIVREMLPVKYDFLLDELVRLPKHLYHC
ncbi:hypothetical protein HMN09_00562900 [Mycena chlorophos]|uniref:CxC5 like cysteine cluster associated with KDZ domain-containing protein n=1 Tax=Mycena chlorophos TaxID=658473 RepID=A0A8H6WGJ1_MYCCL|nr:hypothetical protein HMN09_00562900 [Mycena chlorophos]